MQMAGINGFLLSGTDLPKLILCASLKESFNNLHFIRILHVYKNPVKVFYPI